MPTVNLSPLGGAASQFLDNNGVILSGGKIYTYAAGTTTPQTSYTSASGVTPHANPIILDSAGRVPGGEIWLIDNLTYKFAIETAASVLLGTYDNVPGINDTIDINFNANAIEYDPPFAGAVTSGYTVAEKLSQTVSVQDFGAVGDGITNDWIAIEKALNASNSIYFPTGTYRIDGARLYNLPTNKFLYGDGSATLYFATANDNLTIQNLVKATTTITADLAIGQSYMNVASVAGVSEGDLIHIDTATQVSSIFNYQKQCVRRVVGVVGNTISFDQPLDFFFTVSEAPRVDFANPLGIQVNGVNVLCGDTGTDLGGNYLRIIRTANSAWENASIAGSVRGWSIGWSDVFLTISCDRTLFNNVQFIKSRYSPRITDGSRYTVVSNFTAFQVRHLDTQVWSQDTLFVNGFCFDTDGVIQTHPSIRNTFRNVHDSINRPNLFGLDLRSVGDIVEDCSASRTDGVIGFNTNGVVPLPAYVDWALGYKRRITRFNSTTAVIQNRDTIGDVEINDCNVPDIALFDGADIGSIRIGNGNNLSSPGYRLIQEQNTRSFANNGLIPVYWEPGFGYDGVPTAVTAITKANPGVVTSTAHGLSDGNLVRLTAVTGMTEVNYVVFTVTNATANTFELYTTDTVPTPVDTSAYETYISGGFAGKQKNTRSFQPIWSKNVGRWPQRKYYLPNLWRETVATGSLTRTFTLQLYTETSPIPSQTQFWTRLTFIAKGNNGSSETVYDVAANRYPTNQIYFQKTTALTTDINGWSITLANPIYHFKNLQDTEGASGLVGSDYYWTVDVTVTLPATSRILYELDCEVRELNRGVNNPS